MDTRGRMSAVNQAVNEIASKNQELARLAEEVEAYKTKFENLQVILQEEELRLDSELKKAEALLAENKSLKATVLKSETGIR